MKKLLHKGMILTEVVVGASVLVVFISALVVTQKIFIAQSSSSIERTQAALLAEEGIEAVKHLRDEGWDEFFSSNGTFSLQWDSDWSTTSVPEIIDDMFSRTVTVEDVHRDGSFNIVSSGGVVDPNTKKVTVQVEWTRNGNIVQKTMSTYITNIHE